MAASLYDMSVTDASNTAFNGISQAENVMVPSNVNNDFRAHDGALARYIADEWAVNTATGTDTYALTAAQGITAYATGIGLRFVCPNTNTGASTLNVNTIGTKAIRKISGGTDVALVAGDLAAGETYTVVYRSAANAAAGAWVLVGVSASIPAATNGQALGATSTTVAVVPANLAQERALGAQAVNIGIAASVGSSALTVALKGIDGNDPSATNPVTIPFRNVTAATGTPSYLTVTAATSVVISSGSTMGFTSAVIGRLWVVAFNDGGTFRLGLVNALSGTSIMTLRDGIYSSTAEGGAGAADSAQVIYTGTAVTSKAMTVLGYIEATEATAGTWATAPSLIKVWQPGDPLPGDTVQVQRNATGTVATGSTALPADNTIPQSTEGTQFMTQAITPNSGANLLSVRAQLSLAINGGAYIVSVALFRDSTANALAASQAGAGTNLPSFAPINNSVLAGSTTATTFKIRAGNSAGDVTTFNGSNTSQAYGGVYNSFMEVVELMA